MPTATHRKISIATIQPAARVKPPTAAKTVARPETHTSVMLEEVLRALDVQPGELVLDATAGQGGHSFALLKKQPKAHILALDADPEAVALARARLKGFGARAEVVEANFSDIAKMLKKQKIKTLHKAVFDLGWNRGQLQSGRGFSFLHDEPLTMSYGKKPLSGFTAHEIVNEWDEETLANVFFGYGEEKYARRIAGAIVARRKQQPIATTIELVEIIRDSVPAAYRRSRLHPATKTFQALRIAVNNELGALDQGVRAAWEALAPSGRIAVITFHSVEDRAVKKLFIELAKQGGKLVYKKPLAVSQKETSLNPSARSAKLRVIEKTQETL